MGQIIDMEAKKAQMIQSTAFEKLKQEWNENPLLVIGMVAAAFTAVSKVIDSITGIQSRRAYATKMRGKR